MTETIRRWMFGSVDTKVLPSRVRSAIEDQQLGSERLIGWAQLVIVVIFGALYAFSPKTFSRDLTFEPVPWALAAYLAFTLLRLALAYGGGLPRWFLALSVVIDMALLLGLIWSFHLQYMQPPAFYLKAPTLLYVFIFIALRALRYEAGFVVLAGVVAAGGWLALVVYAVMSDPRTAMVTRDYVEYMTSATILLGAEFDKIISILVVTAILAIAIRRARGVLVRAVAESTAARDLARFFAPEVARRITASAERIAPGDGEIRDAAILFCDIRGFTRLANTLPPATTMRLLAEYERRLVAVIQRHEGSIDKFLGDGIMATFGAAVPSDSYAADALRSVEDLIEAVDAWAAERIAAGEAPLAVNFAVATGRIVFGAIGDETRLEYTVVGEAVNLSAKLEKHNKTLGSRALTTAEGFALAVAQGYRPAHPPLPRPGERIEALAAPLDLVVLAG